MSRFTHYVSLGDSISIDAYPGLDHQEQEKADTPRFGLGAASLLHRNDDVLWPEFRGRDLATWYPGLVTQHLVSDGATTPVARGQIELIEAPPDAAALVTLTIGGNDLLGLMHLGYAASREGLAAIAADVSAVVEAVAERLPRALLLLATVYDPTDGTGDLSGERLSSEKLALVSELNDAIRSLARPEKVVIADLHAHFFGHGVAAPPEERWYWRHLVIEPGLRGASEVRRVWLSCLDG